VQFIEAGASATRKVDIQLIVTRRDGYEVAGLVGPDRGLEARDEALTK
jgi:hypothetical protein